MTQSSDITGQTSQIRGSVPWALSPLSEDQVATVVAEARRWVADCEWGEYVAEPELLAELSDFEILRGVNRHYEGGLAGFVDAIAELLVPTISGGCEDLGRCPGTRSTERTELHCRLPHGHGGSHRGWDLGAGEPDQVWDEPGLVRIAPGAYAVTDHECDDWADGECTGCIARGYAEAPEPDTTYQVTAAELLYGDVVVLPAIPGTQHVAEDVRIDAVRPLRPGWVEVTYRHVLDEGRQFTGPVAADAVLTVRVLS